jgi:hypothetical protein
MKDYIGQLCAWYLNGKRVKQQGAQKIINDKKMEEVGKLLKSLQEFIKFLDEKVFANKHERKAFWNSVSDGLPVLEETIEKMMLQYGVKQETVDELKKRKADAIQQGIDQEIARKKAETEAKRVKELPYIKNNICINRGEYACELGYACDGCRYNRTTVAVKKLRDIPPARPVEDMEDR